MTRGTVILENCLVPVSNLASYLPAVLFLRRVFDPFHTKIAGERLADFLFGWIGIDLQERVARDHHPRRAIAALERVIFNESLLNRAQLTVLGQVFDRRDYPTVRLHREVKTGFYDFTVEQHGARAAFADHAAHVRAGEAYVLAEKMREQDTRFNVFFVEPAVDGHSYRYFHYEREYRVICVGSTETGISEG